ncbi:hypothetical protein ccbrp13_40320 [Ktedonobacteria bacterium brp13]|nr:hypothetical protein ccbrp13_40320 [Ktedonobacteria bacterium brp13]
MPDRPKIGQGKFREILPVPDSSLDSPDSFIKGLYPKTGESLAIRAKKANQLDKIDPETGESVRMKGTRLAKEVRVARAKYNQVAEAYGQQELDGIEVKGIPSREPGTPWTGAYAGQQKRFAEKISRNNEEADEGVLWSSSKLPKLPKGGYWARLPDVMKAGRDFEQKGIPPELQDAHNQITREMNVPPDERDSSDSE